MGRGRKPKSEQAPWREERPAYTYWSGVDAYRSPRTVPKARAKSKPVFPAYDAMEKDSSGITEVVTLREAPSRPRNQGLVQDVQQAVNAARKVEQKLARLKTELAQRKNSWVVWIQRMMQAYNREQTRFQQDRTRLTAEIDELEQQRHSASQDIKRVAMEITATPRQEVAALMEIDEDLADTSLGPELVRLLQAAAGNASSEAAASVTPVRPTHAAPRTPAHQATPEMEVAGRDPYLTSPGMAHFGLHGSGPPGLGQTGARPPEGSAPPPTPGVDPGAALLAEKLSAKRRATRQALAPFGIPAKSSGEGVEAASRHAGAPEPPQAATPAPSLIDDDPDEVMNASQSPGLNRASELAFATLTGVEQPILNWKRGHHKAGQPVPCIQLCGFFLSHKLAFELLGPEEDHEGRGLLLGENEWAPGGTQAITDPPFAVPANWPSAPPHQHSRRPLSESLEVVRLPVTGPEESLVASGRWLGIVVYAPYYQLSNWAVRLQPDCNVQDVMERLLMIGSDLFDEGIDTIIPINPPRYRGFGCFLAYPKCMGLLEGCRQVAAIVDASCVGGHYFAAALPHELNLGELLAYLKPQLHVDFDQLLVYVGCSPNPASEREPLILEDGDAITVLSQGYGPPRPFDMGVLFDATTELGQLQHIPRYSYAPGYCLIHQGERWLMHARYHSGRSPAQAVAFYLDCDVKDLTIGASGDFVDLDLLGEPCNAIICAVKLPSPDNDGEGLTHEDHLRLLLQPFGGGNPPAGIPPALMQQAAEEASDDDTEFIRAMFVIMTPDYFPDVVVVPLRPPATLPDAMFELESVRIPERRRRFTWLSPAQPQLTNAYAVIVALPEWLEDLVAVFDLRTVNGTAFSECVPPIATREELLAIAGLGAAYVADVFVHVAQNALLPGQQVALWTGVTVVIAEVGHDLEVGRTIEDMLLSPDGWNPDAPLPLQDTPAFLLLTDEGLATPAEADHRGRRSIRDVLTDRRRLIMLFAKPFAYFAPRLGAPWRYNPPSDALFIIDDDGSEVDSEDEDESMPLLHFTIIAPGFTGERLVLSLSFPATVEDILTRIAAVRKPDIALHFPRLLPVRPQPVPGSGLLIAAPVWTDAAVPNLVTVCFDTSRVDGRIFAKAVPSYLHYQQILCIAGLQDLRHIAIFAGGDDDELHEDAWYHAQDGDAFICVCGMISLARLNLKDDRPIIEPSLPGPLASRKAASAGSFCLVLMAWLSVLEYLTTFVDLSRLQVVRMLLQVADILQQLQSRRTPHAAACLPRLVAVHPQPCLDHAIILSMPIWHCDGAVVVIDSRRVNSKCSAIQIGTRATRYGILVAAGLDDEHELDVYVRDLPWPLVDGAFADLRHGDLVLVARRRAQAHTVASLQDMLGSVVGWDPNFQLPRRSREVAWVLGPDSFCLAVSRPGQQLLIRDLAAEIGIPEGQLVLRPARPAIDDFDRLGQGVDNVVVATSLSEPRLGDHPDRPICYIDFRPLLLQIDWYPCPEGYLSAAPIVERMRSRCPAGYELGIVRNGTVLVPLRPRIPVSDRETLIFTFVHPELDFRLFPSDHDGSFLERDDGYGSGRQPEDPSSPGASSRIARGNRSDAGTGSIAPRHDSTHASRVCANRRVNPQPCATTASPRCSVTQVVCAHFGLCLGMIVCAFLSPAFFWAGCILLQCRRPSLAIVGLLLLTLVRAEGTCAGIPSVAANLAQHGRPPVPRGRHLLSAESGFPPSRRPIPTPARALNARRVLIPEQVDECLPTLLDVAVRRQDCQAFMLAATLVDTLSEHFAVKQFSSLHAPCKPRSDTSSSQVCLNDLCPERNLALPIALPPSRVGVPPHTIARHRVLCVGNTPLGFNVADLSQLLHGVTSLAAWPVAARLVPALGAFEGPKLKDFVQNLGGGSTADIWCFTDGSFFPSNPSRSARLGWAALFFQPDTFACGWAAGHVDTELLGGPGRPSAFVSECVALGAAQLISAIELTHATIHFRSDCQAALAAIAGQVHGSPDTCAMFAINARTLRAQVAGPHDSFQYVEGHAGVLGNEIADLLSKFGARSKGVSHGLVRDADVVRFWLRSGGNLLAWAGLAIQSLRGNAEAPPLCDADLGQETDQAGLSPLDLLRPFVPPGLCPDGLAQPSFEAAAHLVYRLDLCLASFNALSLLPPRLEGMPSASVEVGLAFQTGAAAILERQLHAHGVQLAFLQETRCPEGTLHTGRYRRLCSGAVRGQRGSEIWILDEAKPLRTADGNSWPLSATRATVLHSDPRRLIARIPCGPLSILAVCLHGPHRAFESTKIVEWWQETGRLVKHHCRQDFVVIAGDFNAAIGSRPTEAFGDLHAETEDCAGEQAQQLALETRTFAPNTFPDLHRGDSYTYHQKKSDKVLRTDYVMLPFSWRAGQVLSYTAPKIHAGHATEDHVATCVDVSIDLRRPAAKTELAGRKFRAGDVCDPENQAAVRQLLLNAPAVPWHVSAHAHAAIVTNYVQQGLRRLTTVKQSRPKHPFLRPETWELQQHLAKLRHTLHTRRRALNRHRMLAAFQVWRHPVATYATLFLDNVWVLRTAATQTIQAQHMQIVARALRAACKADRDQYICKLADEVANGPANAVFASLHKLLAHKRKRPFHLEPLPALNKVDGHKCADHQEVLATWRQHFGSLEGGQETSFEQLAMKAYLGRQFPAGAPLAPHPAALGDVASPAQMQLVLRATKIGKAAGLDGLPPELCRLYAAELTPLLHPLLLKTAWRGQEPVGWKGGATVYFHKRRGRFDDCSSYRAVLLLSTWAKACHKCLRAPLKLHFEASAPALQLGGKTGSTVVFGAHLVRTVVRHAVSRGTACYTIFADIASAFYSVVTSLVAGHRADMSDQEFQTLTRQLNLAPGELQALRDGLSEPAAMDTMGATPWLQSVTERMSANNWFLLKEDSIPAATQRGTRPGSSFADLVFAMLIPKILARRDSFRGNHHHGVPPTFPWDGERTLEPCDASEEIEVGDVIWADDLAVPRSQLTSSLMNVKRLLASPFVTAKELLSGIKREVSDKQRRAAAAAEGILYSALLLFALSVVSWLLDNYFCSVLRNLPGGLPYPQLHTWWHVLIALTLHCIMLLLHLDSRRHSSSLVVDYVAGFFPMIRG
ncbi:Shprh [Symbiodinium sp. KB8]|nr:Shprh [Symbiodinium sp. KB8]